MNRFLNGEYLSQINGKIEYSINFGHHLYIYDYPFPDFELIIDIDNDGNLIWSSIGSWGLYIKNINFVKKKDLAPDIINYFDNLVKMKVFL